MALTRAMFLTILVLTVSLGPFVLNLNVENIRQVFTAWSNAQTNGSPATPSNVIAVRSPNIVATITNFDLSTTVTSQDMGSSTIETPPLPIEFSTRMAIEYPQRIPISYPSIRALEYTTRLAIEYTPLDVLMGNQHTYYSLRRAESCTLSPGVLRLDLGVFRYFASAGYLQFQGFVTCDLPVLQLLSIMSHNNNRKFG